MSLDTMKQALELLESAHVATDLVWKRYDCITALRAAIEQANEFNPDWDALSVMVEEQQRMAKRIDELEAQQKPWVKTYAGGKPNYTVPEEQQEPIGHADFDMNNIYIFSALEDRRIPIGRTPLYTAPRQWQGLTDEELREAYLAVSGNEWCLGGMSNAESFYEAIEAKLKEKNT